MEKLKTLATVHTHTHTCNLKDKNLGGDLI